jgi:hypothetical protein
VQFQAITNEEDTFQQLLQLSVEGQNRGDQYFVVVGIMDRRGVVPSHWLHVLEEPHVFIHGLLLHMGMLQIGISKPPNGPRHMIYFYFYLILATKQRRHPEEICA